MYKSKLQELCQRQGWELPEYTTVKDGADHMPRFTGSVNVKGQLFETPESCKSSKEAQNTAARIAFDHFSSPTPAPSPPVAVFPEAPLPPIAPPPPSQIEPLAVEAPLPPIAPLPPPLPSQIEPLAVGADSAPLPLSPLPSSLPDPPVGLLMTKYNVTKPAKELAQGICDDTTQCAIDNNIAIGSEYKDVLHMYKNLLQQHAQKQNIVLPVYTYEAEGPPHNRRFRSKVFINGKSYETVEYFPTLMEAEQAVAKIACQALSVDTVQEDKGLYKNLLQEYAQKKGLVCPSYETVNSGMSHKPIFVSTVEIDSETYKGVEAKTRKQAETNAARVAYFALTKGCSPSNSLKPSSTNVCPLADNLSPNIQPIATNEKHQAATDEEVHLHPKRAKSSPANEDSRLHSVPPLVDSNMENSTPSEPVLQPKDESMSSIEWKTVTFPREAKWPIPEGASVMPYSNEKWVAYRVKLDQK